MRVSHIMVAVWALVMSCVASLWIGIGVSLNWLFLFSGTLFTGAVGPVIFSVVWRQQTKEAAISGALGGVVVGVIAWLVVAKSIYGELTIASTGKLSSALKALRSPLTEKKDKCIPISLGTWALAALVLSFPQWSLSLNLTTSSIGLPLRKSIPEEEPWIDNKRPCETLHLAPKLLSRKRNRKVPRWMQHRPATTYRLMSQLKNTHSLRSH